MRFTWPQAPEASAWATTGTSFWVNLIRPTCLVSFDPCPPLHGKENRESCSTKRHGTWRPTPPGSFSLVPSHILFLDVPNQHHFVCFLCILCSEPMLVSSGCA